MKLLTADYVLPVSSEPIENGAVVVENDVIVAVGTLSDLAGQFPNAEPDDFNEAVILPGFVNCHSHLEITAMRGLLDEVEHDFLSWLLKLNGVREEMASSGDIDLSAIAGAIEGARSGVTCFGDIGRFGRAGFEALKTVGLRGVLFQETEFWPHNDNAAEDLEKLREKFAHLKEGETELVEVGLSPHSPYTVSPKLFEKITEFALSEGIKITIHAAESVDEDDLMRHGTGLFAGLLDKFGVAWQSPKCSSIEYLAKMGVLRAKPLLAHCIKVSDSDIELIAESGSTVAHCPKSNAKFGHGYAPLERFLEAGVSIGLGSDSVASNNSCDMLEESRFAVLAARNQAGRNRLVTAKEAIELATLGGAKAVGLDDKVGTLEPGKQADLAVVSLANTAQQPVHDIYAALVFASNARDVVMTMAAGLEIFRDGEVQTIDEAETRSKMKEIMA